MSLEGMDPQIGDLIYLMADRIKRLQDKRDIYREALIQIRKLNDNRINDLGLEELIDAVLPEEEGGLRAVKNELDSEDFRQ